LIEVKDVTKYYGPVLGVEDISLEVEKGEIVGLLGPNAAGKTTLMRILTGYLPATSGSVSVGGFDVFEQPLEVKRRIGYLPESPPLYRDMSVRQYIAFAAEIKGVPRGERREKVDRAIESAGLKELEHRLIENLSKGYRQRVGLAQALVHEPEVLILDEPMVGLDPRQIIEIRNLVRGLAEEHTVLLSSHILPEITATCERIVILNEGRIVAEDTQDGLARKVRGGGKLAVRIGGATPDEALAAIRDIEPVTTAAIAAAGAPGVSLSVDCEQEEAAREAIFKTVVGKNWTLLEIHSPELSLEEVFLKITSGEGGEVAASA